MTVTFNETAPTPVDGTKPDKSVSFTLNSVAPEIFTFDTVRKPPSPGRVSNTRDGVIAVNDGVVVGGAVVVVVGAAVVVVV